MRAAVEQIPEAALKELAEAVREEARPQGLFLQREDGKTEMIPVALTPWVFSPGVARYLKSLFRGLRRTVNRVLARYFEDPKLQAILPLRESELRWLQASCPEGIPRPQTIFERFDTNLGAQPEGHLADFQIIEFNAVGVGCVYLAPAATELLKTHLLPKLRDQMPEPALISPNDYRQLLLNDLQAHSRATDRPSFRVGLVERRETTPGGCDEFSFLAEFFRSKEVPTVVGDPREVDSRNGQELTLRGEPVDVFYRDFQLEEVVSIKTHGGSVEGIEAAFARNRVVSTVFGEFDHKSLCELLSNPDFTEYLTPQEIRSMKRHVPWTRLLLERRTISPEGREIDLVPFVREHREELVLKPNRGYGGEGVVVGRAVTVSVWEQALEGALEKPGTWVVQEQVRIAQEPVMLLKAAGRPQTEERYVTLGVTATSRGVSFVGRCSDHPVVNISQGGGLVPVFLAGGR